MKTMIITTALLLAGCAPSGEWADAKIETRGEPIAWQLLGSYPKETGLYRYIDKETGVVLYLNSTLGGYQLVSAKTGVAK